MNEPNQGSVQVARPRQRFHLLFAFLTQLVAVGAYCEGGVRGVSAAKTRHRRLALKRGRQSTARCGVRSVSPEAFPLKMERNLSLGSRLGAKLGNHRPVRLY